MSTEADALLRCANAIRGGHAICFTGSGFSTLAKNNAGEHLPTGRGLNRLLSDLLGINPTYDLDITSREFQLKFGEHQLINLLRTRLTAAEATLAQKIVATQPWLRIYTTNYDNVLKLACRQAGRTFEFVNIRDKIGKFSDTTVVYLNGNLSNVTINNFETEIKLTRASYLTDTFLDTQWHAFFKTDLHLATAVVFFGYSMYDIDIARIIYRDPQLKQRTYFVEPQDVDEVFKRELQQYGIVLPIGIEKLADNLIRLPPLLMPTLRLTSIKEETLPSLAQSVTGTAVLNLVMQGDIIDEVILGSRVDDTEYLISRGVVDRIQAHMRDGMRRALVHADLGNGKTTLLHDLKLRLLQSTVKVYSLTEYDSFVEDDLRSISLVDGPKAFLIEDFFRNAEAVQKISHMFPAEVVICTARTSVFDLEHEKVGPILGAEYREFDVNRLEKVEVENLIKLIDQNGLWGEFSSKNVHEKTKFVTEICNSELRNFLIKLFESPMFKDRLLRYFHSDLNDQFLKWLISVFFLDIAGLRPDTMIASEMSGVDIFAKPQMVRTAEAREFVDLSSGQIRVKSSVLGQYILQHVFEPELILSTLISCAKNCDKARFGNDTFYDILKAISKFSFVDRIFLRARGKDYYIRLYDELKTLGAMERNPQF